MTRLLDHLEGFNSKERFYLITQVLGRTNLWPSPDILKLICAKLEIHATPGRIFAAMDYHLDWLYASLRIAADGADDGIYLNDQQIVRAQQEDIDYLLAMEVEGTIHIILVEAKGVTHWDNGQLRRKAMRFGQIFGPSGAAWHGVQPHFILMSPGEPEKIESEAWPSWMMSREQLHWIPLQVPPLLRKVTRCDALGEESESGTYWCVTDRPKPRPPRRRDDGPTSPGAT